MPNAPLIIETALLLLAAFLIGCVAGYLLRRLVAGKPRAAAVQSTAAPASAAGAGEPLVVAPDIAPIAVSASRPTPVPAAQAADAAQPVVERSDVIQPARVAGQTTSGKLVPAPIEPPPAPEVMPEEPEGTVVAAEVPPIDEAIHVLDPGPAETRPAKEEQTGPAPSGIDWTELSGRPEEELRSRLDAESEQAAMRAIEGGWTPRAAPRSRPVELPEPIKDILPGATSGPEPAAPAGVSAAEVAGALSSSRSAVAAASAAADAALSVHADPAASAPALDRVAEAVADEPRESHLHTPFGRPAGLAEPRAGGKDELRRIKGMTPQAEAALNALGVFHFDQIAAWDKKSAVWIDNHLALRGSVARDKWIEQARDLARVRAPGFRAAGKR